MGRGTEQSFQYHLCPEILTAQPGTFFTLICSIFTLCANDYIRRDFEFILPIHPVLEMALEA